MWQAHVVRAVNQIRRLRVGMPHPGLARRDPPRLARRPRGGTGRLFRDCRTRFAGTAARLHGAHPAPRDRRPGNPASGLDHAARVHAHRPAISEAGGPCAFGPRRVPPYRQRDRRRRHARYCRWTAARLVSSGSIRAASRRIRTWLPAAIWRCSRDGGDLAGWDLTVVADQPPTAAWAEPPGPAPADPQHVRLPWRTADDYGVVSLSLEMRLRERPSAAPIIINIPIAGEPKSAHGVNEQDLTASPWAGLAVTARAGGAGFAGATRPQCRCCVHAA